MMTEEQIPTIEIIASCDFLRIKPIRFSFPDAELDYDKNWLEALIEIKTGAFSGQFKGELMTLDLEKFKQELRILYKDLKTTANLSCPYEYF